MKSTLGNNMERRKMVEALLLYNFNSTKAINHLLNNSEPTNVKPMEKKEKGDYNNLVTALF